MTRREVSFETLSAYVDGELDASRELELRRHLDGCDRCREGVDALQGLKELVTSARSRTPCEKASRQPQFGASRGGLLGFCGLPRPPSWLVCSYSRGHEIG